MDIPRTGKLPGSGDLENESTETPHYYQPKLPQLSRWNRSLNPSAKTTDEACATTQRGFRGGVWQSSTTASGLRMACGGRAWAPVSSSFFWETPQRLSQGLGRLIPIWDRAIVARAHHCQADAAELLEAIPKGQRSVGSLAPGSRPRRLDIPIGCQSALSFGQRPAGQSGRLQRGGESVPAYREDQLPVPSGIYPLHRHTR